MSNSNFQVMRRAYFAPTLSLVYTGTPYPPGLQEGPFRDGHLN
jgi:hypothetical protein